MVPHQLGQDAARARVEAFLENVQRDYAALLSQVNGQWEGNALAFGFVASGLRVSGILSVQESAAVVDGKLPLAAAFFRGQIERSIREQLLLLLG